MADELTGFGILPDPMLTNPESGQPTAQAKRAVNDHYREIREDEFTLLDEALTTNNSIYDAGYSVMLDISTPPEEGFDVTKDMPWLFDGVPPEFHKRIAQSQSGTEALAVRSRIDEYQGNLAKINSAGFSGTAAMLAAGLVDADALLIPVSGGTYLGTKLATGVARAGVQSARVANMARGLGAGLESSAIVGAASSMGITTDPGDIPAMLLTGMTIGTTIGTVLPTGGGISPEAQKLAAGNAQTQYMQAKERGFTPDPERVLSPSKSMGSAQLRVETPSNLSPSSRKWFERAASDLNAMNAREVLAGRMDAETTNIDSFIGRGAAKMQNWVDKSPLKSLYTEVANLGVIGNKLAYDLLYHPGGVIDGAPAPAAGYESMYHQELSIPLKSYHEYAMQYLERPNQNLTDRIRNSFVGQEQYRKFDRAVRMELEARYHGDTSPREVHKAVKAMADELDEMHKKAIKIQQGMPGEIPVFGSEALTPKPGYYSRRWSGEGIKEIEAKVPNGAKAIEDALVKGYMNVLPRGTKVNPDNVRKIVRSIITRAKALDDGIDTNLIGLLRAEGKEFLRNTLKNNSIPDEDIQSLLDALAGKSADRSKPGFLKERIELDMRTPIEGTEYTLMDLLDPDMFRSLHHYIRKVSGTSALARKGYQLGDKDEIIESIKDEMIQNGLDVKDPRVTDVLNTAFSYFGAGAIGSGIDPMVLSAMRVTRQSLLGTLGLTQLTELGNVVSAVGVEAAFKVFPQEIRALVSGKKTPLVQEMHDAFIFLDRDHVLYDDALALDLTGRSSSVQSSFVNTAHKVIARGDKISGFTSLFYQTNSFSQRLALAGINHKLVKTLMDMDFSLGVDKRLIELGLDESMAETLQKYVKNGTIKRVDDTIEFNFDSWDPKVLQDYKLAMNMFVARAVQKNLAGELPYWATKQFGQVIAQLRMFPIQALQKQFLRNMRHADSITATAMMWNLGIAGLVYGVSETIKGRGDQLTMERLAKGAINYAPTSGWIPMAVDPVAEIMGLDALKMNRFGPPGRATDGIIPTPPVLPTLNRIAHIPGALLGMHDGLDRQEISALSATPIIGNTYGFSALFNYMKD